ncbi:MAG: asparaginase [Bacteroidetes bacterium]|nr:asparaginase [Bacteroidota bacterium]MCL1968913.1 asparaginase [Bacteroidota bacterium]
MSLNSKILVIYTGGTIGMMMNKETNALEPFPFEDIYVHLPMLRLVNAEISVKEMLPLIDSSDTTPEFWVRLATLIYDNYNDYDGFVVLHGTDTMAYTASALCFLLENLSKPVILTGSQLPLGVMRTDGRENILNSIEIAAAKKDGKPRVPEVCIYFEDSLFRGNRAYKDNAEHFNAFHSANYPKLAEVGVHIKYNDAFIRSVTDHSLKLHTKMDVNIAILKLYPGITKQAMQSVFNTEGLRAVILETFGSGNAPSKAEFISILEEAVNKGIVIVNVTQCKGGGTVEVGRYGASLLLKKIGVVSGHDITTEAAVAKLMYFLGEGFNNAEVKRYMGISLRGEITV